MAGKDRKVSPVMQKILRVPHGGFLRQHRIMGQELSTRDFAPGESWESAGILDVFPTFQTARVGQKIRRRPQLPLCGVALSVNPIFMSFIWRYVEWPPVGRSLQHKRTRSVYPRAQKRYRALPRSPGYRTSPVRHAAARGQKPEPSGLEGSGHFWRNQEMLTMITGRMPQP